jgi:threonine dehydratase
VTAHQVQRTSLSAARIQVAADLLRPHVRRTPLERSSALSARAGTDVLLKLECLQRTGSFKLRGALNALMSLPEAELTSGVVTASAGNHGLGIASAAELLDARATIFVPAEAPTVKVERIRRLGAEVRLIPGGYDAAHAAAIEFAKEHGLPFVEPSTGPDVIAGQGTVAAEILDQLESVRTIVVPVGGGGLLAGIGSFVRDLELPIRLVGVQSSATGAMHASLAAGVPTSVPVEPTLCEGLAGDVDEIGLGLARSVVDELVLVEERTVAMAIRELYFGDGVVAEGSGAVGVAALLEGRLSDVPGPIVIIVTGANIDASRLALVVGEDNGA